MKNPSEYNVTFTLRDVKRKITLLNLEYIEKESEIDVAATHTEQRLRSKKIFVFVFTFALSQYKCTLRKGDPATWAALGALNHTIPEYLFHR